MASELAFQNHETERLLQKNSKVLLFGIVDAGVNILFNFYDAASRVHRRALHLFPEI